MMKPLLAMLLLTSFVLFSCESKSNSFATTKDHSLAVSLPLPCKTAEVGSIATRATVKVTGADIETITSELDVEPCKVSGVIENIPAGANRSISIEIFSDKELLLYSGSANIDVQPGLESKVVIKLTRSTGSISVTGIICSEDVTPFEPDDNTLALYHFDEESGDVLKDAMNKWDGKNGGAERCSGKWNKALNINAESFAKFDTIISNGMSQGTAEMYIQFTDGTKLDGNYSLFGNDGCRVQFIYKNGSLIFMKNHSNVFKHVAATVSMKPGVWYHIAGTWGSKGMQLFLDGALLTSNTDATVYQSSPRGIEENIFYSGKKTYMGMEAIGISSSLYFIGLIDEVRISSVVRY